MEDTVTSDVSDFSLVTSLQSLINADPYAVGGAQKSKLQVELLSALTRHHYVACSQYKRILDLIGFDLRKVESVEEIPFIPVRLFKDYELRSIDRSKVVKTMTSSGTSGEGVSKIFLDRETAANQTAVLTKLVSNFIGKKRRPLLIIDSSAVIRDRNLFSARGAGILGFSVFGFDITYALDDQMQIDLSRVRSFVEKHAGQSVLVFGFTSFIWEFCEVLNAANVRLPLCGGVMIHGGGWKKLTAQSVSNELFRQRISEVCGLSQIHNYYGMVEQTGSIFLECEAGSLHTSIFSDIVIRDHRDFSVLTRGQGIVQLMSLLPLSYPGHSILSEDVGEIIGEDDCPCGRRGKRFRIHGRLVNAELRGCSDTYVAGA